MIDQRNRLRFLIENDLFQLCRPLTASQFVTFCNDRAVSVGETRLEGLERTGVFYPMARVRFIKLTKKIEYFDEGRSYRDLGALEENEVWVGETRQAYAHFWFRRDYALGWLDAGCLWDPTTVPFSPWSTFNDEENNRAVESFYTPFQILPLAIYISSLTARVPLELVSEWSGSDLDAHGKELKRVADMLLQPIEEEGARERIAFLCQTLSNRYWPYTQGDRRTISGSGGQSRKWKWSAYTRSFEPELHRASIELNTESVRDMQRTVTMDAQHVDPLSNWYDLLTYVSLSQKRRLKGKALLAQTFYAMEHILRLFFHDLTKEALHRPDEGYDWKRDDLYGDGVTPNQLQHLEFLANRFNLNPRPKAILVVEGQTEEAAVPLILEKGLGHRLPVLGIEIRTLRGVGEFEGRRSARLGALEKLIEEYHYRQTVVFIMLDDEGSVGSIREKLTTERSKYFPRRTMMHSDNFVLFRPSFELGNFSDDDLAASMTLLAAGHGVFEASDVAAARRDRRGDPLSRLYKARTGYSLPKPRLGTVLAELIIRNMANEFDDKGTAHRPVVAALDRVIDLTTLNHQPVTLDIWEQNQLSGYFGHPVTEVISKPQVRRARGRGPRRVD